MSELAKKVFLPEEEVQLGSFTWKLLQTESIVHRRLLQQDVQRDHAHIQEPRIQHTSVASVEKIMRKKLMKFKNGLDVIHMTLGII